MSRVAIALLFAGALIGAFAVGRLTARQTAPGTTLLAATPGPGDRSHGPDHPPMPDVPAGAPTVAVVPPGTGRPAGGRPDDPSPATPAAGGAQELDGTSCRRELASLRDQIASEARQRREVDGTPIKTPADVPERFSQGALTSALTLAFKQTRVPGRIETVDCAEYPCIIYGRIQGEEEQLDRLERSRALLPYRSDLQVALLWTTTDETGQRAGQELPELMLFAIAVYSKQDRARYGFELDRRIRVRTADLWNALRPDDDE